MTLAGRPSLVRGYEQKHLSLPTFHIALSRLRQRHIIRALPALRALLALVAPAAPMA